ncbi:SCO0930 family lipoprotein [Streptomyces sp. NPDC091272]|uniref:SCO0930 family lipoprotein n=1 Tax=Streptomyces sp. NPDC091272 TaxID=3365981 RepID=UPI0037FB9E7D
MSTWRNGSLAVTAAAVLALTTACGQDDGDGSAGSRAAGAAAPAAGDGYGSGDGYGDDVADTPKKAGQLVVRNTAQLGEVVTDSAGMTLYRFDKDTAAPPRSNCDGDCAKAWPAVPAEGAAPAPGTAASVVGSVTRSDGSKQLTLGGRPVYRFAKDTKSGELNGQGVGGTWYASAPDGQKAGAAAQAAPGQASPAPGAVAPASPAGLPGMSVRKDPELGEIVVDGKGRTVYRFKKDSAWPMRSACTGDCLAKWPAVAPVAKNDTEGILRKGFVVLDRPDGVRQQTIDCWPLYTFSGDSVPGETNGQGMGGTWYAVSPQGKLVGAPR